VLALGLNTGQLKLVAQDVRQLVQRDIDFQNVLAFLRAARAYIAILAADRIAAFAVAHTHAGVVVVAVTEVGQVNPAKPGC
jgi:hypothetical protein